MIESLLNQRQHRKHLTWSKEKKSWTVEQWSGFRRKHILWKSNPRIVEKVPESGRRGESKVFEVQSEVWSVISSTVGGHPLSGAIRFIWTQHFQQEEHFLSHPSEFFSWLQVSPALSTVQIQLGGWNSGSRAGHLLQSASQISLDKITAHINNHETELVDC